MRVMYDSVRPWEIPANAPIVAGYIDGIYAWKQSDWDRFPNAIHVTISAIGVSVANIVDVEPGCVWPVENAVPWVQRARAAGYDPTVYCNWQNHLTNVKAAFIRAGVREPHYWVAKYDGVREVPQGTIGKQHSAPEAPGIAKAPGHYDISSVADYWPGVDGDDVISNEDLDRVADRVWAKRFNVLVGDSTVENDNGQPVWNSDAGNMLASMWGNDFNPTNAYANMQRLSDQNVALMAAVSAISQNPTLTEARLQAMMNEAVASNTRIVGTISGNLQITGRTVEPEPTVVEPDAS